jgi:LCP family protein required for cell wall assembly
MTPAAPRNVRSGTTAVVLSFLWPGLGQAYQRRLWPAAIFAVPTLGLLVWLLAQLAAKGVQGTALALLDPAFAQQILVVGIVAGVLRLVAMVEAWLFARRQRVGLPMRLATGLLVVLGLLVLGGHSYAAWLSMAFYDAGSAIFVGGGDQDPFASLDPSLAPGVEASGDASSEPSQFIESFPPQTSEAPVVTPAPGERVSILLTGIDSTPTRTHALTDTLLLASVDPASDTGAMVSFPRDLSRLPLYFGGKYMGKINSIASYVRRHPDQFPDGPMTTLTKEVGYLAGVPVQYYAAVDLNGFVKLIELVGGVTVDNPADINDYRYGGWTDGRPIGFHLTAGKHKLDGQEALAFARSRMGAGDSDFSRARRQQILLLALRKKLTDPEMLPKLPQLLEAAGKSIKTNFPAAKLQEMLDLSNGVKQSDIKKVVFGPEYADRATDTSIYELIPDMKKIAKASIRLFGEDSRYYTPPASPSTSP